ncbi:MAG: hypothetical protein PUP93_12670 [Rhizonema sp. NSF051]|nr:hypothetical protein [Rhizonema sp. NSF051]
MTSRVTEIQALIADIDNLLTNKGRRLPRVLSNQDLEPRQVLQRIRDFLTRLTESEAQANTNNLRVQQTQISPLLSRFTEGDRPSLSQQNQPNQEQSALLALQNTSSALLTPLQAELQALLQERATLVQEIRQLEQKRLQNYSLAQQLENQEKMITEFLQAIMSRLAPSNTYTTETTELTTERNKDNTQLAPSFEQGLLDSPFVRERLTQLSVDLDQRLLALDGTVNVVFEALQRNVHTYHDSLSQALARMHSKGVQGEQLLASLVDNLMEQLQQQESSTDLRHQQVKYGTSTLPLGTRADRESVFTSHELKLPANDTQETIEAQQNTDTTSADLDAVLLQLSQETQDTIESQPNDSELMDDEVDHLYASLFGTDNLTHSSENTLEIKNDALTSIPDDLIVTPIVSPTTPTISEKSPLISDTNDTVRDDLSVPTLTISPESPIDQQRKDTVRNDLSVPTPTISLESPIDEPTKDDKIVGSTVLPPALNTYEVQQVEAPQRMPDPWFDQQDAGLLGVNNVNLQNQDIQYAPITSALALSDLYNTFLKENTEGLIGAANYNLVEEPASADTITSLMSLLSYLEGNEELPEIPSPHITSSGSAYTEIAEKPVLSVEAQTLEVEYDDNYTPASPQENLLINEVAQVTVLPDISIEESQLQQLEQDLANFDRQLNSQWQTVSHPEDREEVPQRMNSKLDSNIIEKNVVTSEKASTSPPIQSSDSHTHRIPFSSLLDAARTKRLAANGMHNEGERPESSVGSVSTTHPINNVESPITLESVWYLGIDLGTTGISAALLNRSTAVVYPLYWLAENQSRATTQAQSFRLPAEVYLPEASVSHEETDNKQIEQTFPATVTEEVPENQATTQTHNLFSAHLKPYLQVALPYKNEQKKWEPVLQLNEFYTVPLVWVVRSLSKLLLTLKSDSSSTTIGLTAAAVGLDKQTFQNIINNIAGIICTCPSHCFEQYRFNVREALLISKLVQHPQQVFFMEEAIASLLPELNSASGEVVELSVAQGFSPLKTNERLLVGSTLIINIGAASTEMSLVDLPEHLEDLTHNDFMLSSFAYAGSGIDQDIICQLLFPPKWRQARMGTKKDSNPNNPLQWQPSIPGLEQMRLSTLMWEQLNLPKPGEPDISDRIRLQQRLESSPLGKAMLDAAIALKHVLQHQDTFTLELADQRWVLQRRDLESQVFVPFVRRLNRELNKLLVAKGIPTEAINQAILTGGVASIGAVSRWLKQKLPNAKIIQDLSVSENSPPTCSRVAYGLAMLPLHPQVLEVPRQQYTDYFLFTELLRLIPDQPVTFNEIIQLFENRGINTRSCQQRLLAFLEGELPTGLIPSTQDGAWLTPISSENYDYKAIAAAPLFEKAGSLTYRPNPQQLQSVRRYLDSIKASTQQSLEEPYTVNFVVEAIH